MKRVAMLALLFVVGCATAFHDAAASPATPDQAESSAHLRVLWNEYQDAIKQKDAEKLRSFYLSDAIPVIGAFAPASYAVVSAANKQPVPRTIASTGKENALGEVKLPPDVITNLQIQTDGEVGTISWHYAASIGHGQISWSVLRTNDGWKIGSIVYSINLPAADKKSAGA